MGEQDSSEAQISVEREKLALQREIEVRKSDLERETLLFQQEMEKRKITQNQDQLLVQRQMEAQKAGLERFKIRLDYKKFVLGSVFVALAIAAIPPLFQLATAALEYVKSNADRQAKQQAFRDDYIKEFINNALNQDIELRIRFAQYFARVSTEPFREDWLAYHKDLKETRDSIRKQIDDMEAKWSTLSSARDRNETEIARLERNLAWAYKEVGYVEKNRSAAVNPRTPESAPSSPTFSGPMTLGRFADPVYFLLKPLSWTPKSDQAQKFEPVEVPVGFVTTFDSIPKLFWTVLRPDGEYSYAAIIHDYLYWTQTRPRNVADDVFRQVMEDFGVDPKTVAVLYQGARTGGQAAWDEYARLKTVGEKRILKEFPQDSRVRWSDWKKRAEVFSNTP
jgi:hypothetical protein